MSAKQSESGPIEAYRTTRGVMYKGTAEDILRSQNGSLLGRVQLIFTSPPFPLNRKKRYGNRQGEEYVNWLTAFAPTFRKLLKKDGSIVLEMGNSWEPGRPVMSTLALRALLSFLDKGGFHLCQQFVARYTSPMPPNPILASRQYLRSITRPIIDGGLLSAETSTTA
jgi:DNA methylase